MSHFMLHISVVIPVHRVENCPDGLYRRLNTALKGILPFFVRGCNVVAQPYISTCKDGA